MGRLIRHGGSCVTLAVDALPVPVVQSALRTPLVPAVGSTALLAPGFRAATRTAIALPSVAVRTKPEDRLAFLAAANPLPENHFSMNRHPPAQAAFDKGNGSCQRRTSFDGGLLTKGCQARTPMLRTGGSFPPPSHNTSFHRNVLVLMIDG